VVEVAAVAVVVVAIVVVVNSNKNNKLYCTVVSDFVEPRMINSEVSLLLHALFL
jgi:hypothetical protein